MSLSLICTFLMRHLSDPVRLRRGPFEINYNLYTSAHSAVSQKQRVQNTRPEYSSRVRPRDMGLGDNGAQVIAIILLKYNKPEPRSLTRLLVFSISIEASRQTLSRNHRIGCSAESSSRRSLLCFPPQELLSEPPIA